MVLRALLLGLIAWLLAAGAAAAEAVQPKDRGEQQVLMLLRLPAEHFRAGASYAGSYGDGASRAARRRVATRIAAQHGLTLSTDWPMPLVGLDCFVLDVPAGRSPEAVAAELSRERQVAWSEPMHVYRTQAAADGYNDPLYPLQPAAREWRLTDLHAVATGRGVRVAVIDSGVDADHPDLKGQVAVRESFVPGRAAGELHGTGVAGVIAAVPDNRVGMAGVAPGARLMALRACWQEDASATVCNTLSLAKALHYAIDSRAQVVNLSLSGPTDTLLGKLLDEATARGIVVVGAADPRLPAGGFPASHRGVVSVAAAAGAPGTYAAPGQDVPTTLPGGRWSLVSGSSYSAAHVSGLFAMIREAHPRGPLRASLVTGRGQAVDACANLMPRAACGTTRQAAGDASPGR